MTEALSNLSHWIADFAGTPWALLVLALHSFTESIFNPIPIDPLLISMSVLQPKLALLHAGIGAGSSVAGALVGYWLGQRWGRPLLLKFVTAEKVDRVEGLFQRYGSWAVLIAAITPIPYKVFTITAGVLEMDRRSFLIVSIIGRGARFFLVAGLILLFGPTIERFLGTGFEVLTVAVSGVLIIALLGFFLIMKLVRSKSSTAVDQNDLPESDRT